MSKYSRGNGHGQYPPGLISRPMSVPIQRLVKGKGNGA
jgi:hypothetical protein